MQLLCHAVRDETADVRTWAFGRVDGAAVTFEAGQAVTLTLPMPEGPVHRTFSIASSAARTHTIELTVKMHAGGHATRWMREALLCGAIVESSAPHGRFVMTEATSPLVLVSAGSGATPLMAMLRTLADCRARAVDVAWVHLARRPADVLFGAELAVLQRTLPRLTVSIGVTQPEPGWFGFRGRLARRSLSVMVPDLASRAVFCCGPLGFMDDVRRVYAAEGGDPDRFRVEHYTSTTPAPPLPVTLEPVPGFTIDLDGRRFEAKPSETIFEAASRFNVVIPSGCRAGMCGTCRLHLQEGHVAMRHHGGLLPAEEAAGSILACSSWPRSDLVLRS